MAFSIRRATGWALMLSGVVLAWQALQLFFGSQAYFGLGVFGLVLGGGAGAIAESAVLACICLGLGWWLAQP